MARDRGRFLWLPQVRRRSQDCRAKHWLNSPTTANLSIVAARPPTLPFVSNLRLPAGEACRRRLTYFSKSTGGTANLRAVAIRFKSLILSRVPALASFQPGLQK